VVFSVPQSGPRQFAGISGFTIVMGANQSIARKGLVTAGPAATKPTFLHRCVRRKPSPRAAA